MKRFKAPKAYLASMLAMSLILGSAYLASMLAMSVILGSSLAYGSDRHERDHQPSAAMAPVALGAVASFGVFGGGAGMTNQGMYSDRKEGLR